MPGKEVNGCCYSRKRRSSTAETDFQVNSCACGECCCMSAPADRLLVTCGKTRLKISRWTQTRKSKLLILPGCTYSLDLVEQKNLNSFGAVPWACGGGGHSCWRPRTPREGFTCLFVLDAPALPSRNHVVVVVEQNTGVCPHVYNRLCAAVTCVMEEWERENLVPEHERVVALPCWDLTARLSVGVLCLATPLWTVARAISLLFSCVRARRCIRTVRQGCRNHQVVAAADRAVSSTHRDFELRIGATLPRTLLPSAQLIVPDAGDASCCSASTSLAVRRRRPSK